MEEDKVVTIADTSSVADTFKAVGDTIEVTKTTVRTKTYTLPELKGRKARLLTRLGETNILIQELEK